MQLSVGVVDLRSRMAKAALVAGRYSKEILERYPRAHMVATLLCSLRSLHANLRDCFKIF